MVEVGEKIKSIRTSLGWTQEKLAEKAGLSRSTIINFESGKRIPRIDDLMKIAGALEVETTVFFKANPTLPPKTGGDETQESA